MEKNRIENICILGVGGVGGFFGGKIAHKIPETGDKARKVYFLTRGAHLEKIRADGLILNTVETEGMVCRPATATDRMDEIPPPDLCLLCVKSYDLTDAVRALGKRIKDDTVIVPLLNGVDIYDRIRALLDRGVVLPACVYVGAHIEKPGVVSQVGGGGIILCGEDPKFPDWNPGGLIDFFHRMGVQFKWNKDPFPAIWEKFVFIAAYALVTADGRKTIGEAFSDEAAKESLRKIMSEITAIADRQGILLPSQIVEDSLMKANNFHPETQTSYQRDIELKGSRNEGDLFGGAILRLGEKFNIPTPETQAVYCRIQSRF